MLQSHKSTKAYIPLEHKPICVRVLHCDRPPMQDFGITYTNMLASKKPCGPNANHHGPHPGEISFRLAKFGFMLGMSNSFLFVSFLFPLATPHKHGF